MVTERSLDDLALRWEKWVVDTNELFSDSDKLGVPIVNTVHYLWIGLRDYVEALPEQIRSGEAVAPPLPVADRPAQADD